MVEEIQTIEDLQSYNVLPDPEPAQIAEPAEFESLDNQDSHPEL